MKRKVYFTIVCMLFAGILYGQTAVKALQFGDQVPDLDFTIHTGNITSQVRLSDYKGKLVILDFWETHCSTCIAALPHMLALQRQFKGKVQVILIDINEDSVEVNEFWQTLRQSIGATEKGKAIISAYEQLPSCIADNNTLDYKMNYKFHGANVFMKLFPHNSVPTHIWIDGNRIYRHFTEDSESPNDIMDFLKGKKVSLLETNNPEKFDISHPLSWIGKLSLDLEYYSFLTPYLKSEVLHGFRNLLDSASGKKVGFSIINNSLLELYQCAYGGYYRKEARFYPENQIMLEVKYPENYIIPQQNTVDFQNWITKHTYCYAIKVPVSKSDDLSNMMIQQLDKLFDIKSGIEKKKMKCLVLKRTGADKLRTKGGIAVDSLYKNAAGYSFMRYRNVPLKDALSWLKQCIADEVQSQGKNVLPFIDETNYKDNIDMDFPFAGGTNETLYFPFENMRTEILQKYGLELTEEYRDIDVLVLTENGWKAQPLKSNGHFKQN